MVLLTSSNLWYRYFFKRESLVGFFMRKALKTYMHDLGYKLLARKWIHILTTLSYNHNLQYTYKRDMDAVLQLSKRRKWILSKAGYFWIPAFIHQRWDCYQYTEATSLCYVKKRLFPICWCIKTDMKTLLFLKNCKIKTAKFLDRKIYMKNNTFTSTFNM